MASWRETILAPNASVRASIQNLSETGRQIVLVLDERQQLLGVVTDGDIRKALLGGKSLDASVTSIMNSRPRTANHDDSPTTMAQAMRTSGVLQLPVLQNSTFVGLVTLSELLAPAPRSNTVVLMAGGRGQRL
ncbi:MAG: CBS domain-containing protein, partial [Actinomycetota bacterium]